MRKAPVKKDSSKYASNMACRGMTDENLEELNLLYPMGNTVPLDVFVV